MITIDEAIEIKSREGEEFLHTDPDKLDEADRLSIEALKFIKRSRAFGEYPVNRQLPGEAKPVYRGMTETMFTNPERD